MSRKLVWLFGLCLILVLFAAYSGMTHEELPRSEATPGATSADPGANASIEPRNGARSVLHDASHGLGNWNATEPVGDPSHSIEPHFVVAVRSATNIQLGNIDIAISANQQEWPYTFDSVGNTDSVGVLTFVEPPMPGQWISAKSSEYIGEPQLVTADHVRDRRMDLVLSPSASISGYIKNWSESLNQRGVSVTAHLYRSHWVLPRIVPDGPALSFDRNLPGLTEATVEADGTFVLTGLAPDAVYFLGIRGIAVVPSSVASTIVRAPASGISIDALFLHAGKITFKEDNGLPVSSDIRDIDGLYSLIGAPPGCSPVYFDHDSTLWSDLDGVIGGPQWETDSFTLAFASPRPNQPLRWPVLLTFPGADRFEITVDFLDLGAAPLPETIVLLKGRGAEILQVRFSGPNYDKRDYSLNGTLHLYSADDKFYSYIVQLSAGEDEAICGFLPRGVYAIKFTSLSPLFPHGNFEKEGLAHITIEPGNQNYWEIALPPVEPIEVKALTVSGDAYFGTLVLAVTTAANTELLPDGKAIRRGISNITFNCAPYILNLPSGQEYVIGTSRQTGRPPGPMSVVNPDTQGGTPLLITVPDLDVNVVND